jgi:hypothetical protein
VSLIAGEKVLDRQFFGSIHLRPKNAQALDTVVKPAATQ